MLDGLPPEIASQIHPDWRKNEADYWERRAELLARFTNLWIAFAGGEIIASGKSATDIFHRAHESGKHPFVTCVGFEDEPTRVRRETYPYDSAYRPEPLPMMEVEFRTSRGQSGLKLERVIPDTGADASVLPLSDCTALGLDFSTATPSLIAGRRRKL